MNPSANPKYHFLVVDGDIHLSTTFALMLEFYEHEVRTAHTGEAALALLEKERFDLIITEYWLPRMHGDELATTIKQQWPDQPILMATANIEEVQKYIHPLAGVDCLLNKPFSMSQLRGAILWVLDRYAEIRPGGLETHGAHERRIEEPEKPRNPQRPGHRRGV
jgi:DNA-binding response OmpR family regulator